MSTVFNVIYYTAWNIKDNSKQCSVTRWSVEWCRGNNTIGSELPPLWTGLEHVELGSSQDDVINYFTSVRLKLYLLFFRKDSRMTFYLLMQTFNLLNSVFHEWILSPKSIKTSHSKLTDTNLNYWEVSAVSAQHGEGNTNCFYSGKKALR